MLIKVDCDKELCDRNARIDMWRRNYWIRRARTKCKKEATSKNLAHVERSCREEYMRKEVTQIPCCGKIRFPQETLGSRMLIRDQFIF